MRKTLTVGELKEVIRNIPDNTPVRLSSDSGVDQGEGEIIVESAYRVCYKWADKEIDYLAIYCNDNIGDEDEEV